jgi:colicin import membrane protein
MDRLQKKCFMASAALHSLLLVVLLVGALWVVEKEMEDLPVLNFVPDRLVDAAAFAGGAPEAAVPAPRQPPSPVVPAPQPQVQVTRTPEPPKPEPKPERKPEPKPEVAPPKPVAPTEPKKAPEKPEVKKPEPRKPQITPNLTPANKSTPVPDTKVRAEAEAKERAEQAQKFAQAQRQILDRLNRNLTPGTSIQAVGPGGAAFANYAQIVKSIYQRAWTPPTDFNDDSGVVRVIVVVRRNGQVQRAEISSRSGDAALNNSVDKALKEVRFIAPFPPETRDEKRTFEIDFDLKTRKSLG